MRPTSSTPLQGKVFAQRTTGSPFLVERLCAIGCGAVRHRCTPSIVLAVQLSFEQWVDEIRSASVVSNQPEGAQPDPVRVVIPGATLAVRVRARRNKLVGLVIPEPLFAGLEAGDERMSRLLRMSGAVLGGGTVTTTDVATVSATPKMHPPTGTVTAQALDTTRPAGYCTGVDSFDFRRTHRTCPFGRPVTRGMLRLRRERGGLRW